MNQGVRIVAGVAAIATLSAAGPALAHTPPGMSGLAAGLAHPFGGLDHLLAMVAVGIIAGLGAKRVLWTMPAAFVGFLVAGAAFAMLLPGAAPSELAVALSVVALGALIAVPRLLPAPATAAIVALGALAHGFAHGAEAPVDGALAFIAGMAAATLALHISGIAVVRLAALRPFARPAGAAIAFTGLVMAAGVW
jgi:urease accessory protein